MTDLCTAGYSDAGAAQAALPRLQARGDRLNKTARSVIITGTANAATVVPRLGV